MLSSNEHYKFKIPENDNTIGLILSETSARKNGNYFRNSKHNLNTKPKLHGNNYNIYYHNS